MLTARSTEAQGSHSVQPIAAGEPGLESAKAYIQSIDFSPIVNKMVSHEGWKRQHAEKLAEIYRNFLWLAKKYSDQRLPPSEEIDHFWHNHILDTRKYHRDCQAIFGKYHHHYPYFGIDGKTNMEDLNNAFEATQALYLKEFGEPIENVRQRGVLGFIIELLEAVDVVLTKIGLIFRKQLRSAIEVRNER